MKLVALMGTVLYVSVGVGFSADRVVEQLEQELGRYDAVLMKPKIKIKPLRLDPSMCRFLTEGISTNDVWREKVMLVESLELELQAGQNYDDFFDCAMWPGLKELGLRWQEPQVVVPGFAPSRSDGDIASIQSYMPAFIQNFINLETLIMHNNVYSLFFPHDYELPACVKRLYLNYNDDQDLPDWAERAWRTRRMIEIRILVPMIRKSVENCLGGPVEDLLPFYLGRKG